MSKKHIILTGMPGSGKTTLGTSLAQSLHLPFVDTDALIVARMQKSIVEIFAEQGEANFRQIERQILEEIIGYDRSVISTGGGMPCFANNMNLMNSNAFTVYLDVPPDSLLHVLMLDNSRPLLHGKTPDEMKSYIHNLLYIRKIYYEKADFRINPYTQTVEQCVDIIADRIEIVEGDVHNAFV
ncbi:MAG: shikimate kinase [Prevotellaceae bacterium]|jgi:shikimate kinase|nr:shikimate kinase [Prevotellaceae bacterium]